MITRKEFRDAMIIVEKYTFEINGIAPNGYIGYKVKLSDFGKNNLPGNRHKKTGLVLDWLEWSSVNDGLITVKWEGIKKPDVMHIHNIEFINKKP